MLSAAASSSQGAATSGSSSLILEVAADAETLRVIRPGEVELGTVRLPKRRLGGVSGEARNLSRELPKDGNDDQPES